MSEGGMSFNIGLSILIGNKEVAMKIAEEVASIKGTYNVKDLVETILDSLGAIKASEITYKPSSTQENAGYILLNIDCVL